MLPKKNMQPHTFTLTLPSWVESFLAEHTGTFLTIEERMDLVIALADRNIDNKTGGPFGAAIFERDSGKLIAPGINLVLTSNLSFAHAEMVAISFAQQVLGTYDLGQESASACQLVTSVEPCAMCLGAIPWSGVQSVVCGASDQDARDVGFDEGAKPANWKGELEKRGISVRCGVCRENAVELLEKYVTLGGPIY
jgi:tRNA(Arg) A34 adenosine deaminase TadA